MENQFEIEGIVNIQGRGCFVFARKLNSTLNFYVTDESTLGGVELVKFLEIPRATNDKGEQRYDLFVFLLKNPEDGNKLDKKQIVTLIP